MGKKLDRLSKTCKVIRRTGKGKKHSTSTVESNGDKTLGSLLGKLKGRERKKNG